MTDSPDIATTFFAELGAGRVAEALALTSESFTWQVAGKPGGFALSGVYDRDAYLDMLGRVGQSFGDGPHIDVTSVTEAPDRIVIEARVTGRAITGASYDNRLVYVFDIGDGAITAVREYLDTIHAAEVFAV